MFATKRVIDTKLEEALFDTFTEKNSRFKILKAWLKRVESDAVKGKVMSISMLALEPPIALHDTDAVVKRGTELLKGLQAFKPEEKGVPDPEMLNLSEFLTKSHEIGQCQGRVYLPYSMYGEYGPSAAALLCSIPVTVTYPDQKKLQDAEQVAKVLRCFGSGDVGLSQEGPEVYGKFSDLHYDWKWKDVPSAFRDAIGLLADETKLNFFNALYDEALSRELKTRADKPAPKAANPIRFGVWIRNAPNNPSKNMTGELYGVILEELTCAMDVFTDTEKRQPDFEVILLGDPDKTAASETRQSLLKLLNGRVKGYQGDISVVDLRGFVKRQEGLFSNFYAKNQLPPAFEDKSITGVGEYLSYLHQWLVYYYLCTEKRLKFVVGTESGNMDALGYTGTPVISIDLTDPAGQMPLSLLNDRIGQYSWLSPLW